ncbi:MAG: EAL domain-containing protein [Steroidobacteraceae bacterium]
MAALSLGFGIRLPFRDLICELGCRPDGVRYFSFSGDPVLDTQGAFCGYRGIVREISTLVRAQQFSDLERTVAHLLAESDALNAGLRAVLQVTCESLGWQAGHFWSVDPTDYTLQLAASWQPGVTATSSVLRSQFTATPSLDGKPVWTAGVGILVPARSGRELTGVLEFNAPRAAEPDVPLEDLLCIIAMECAHFCGRALAVSRLRESEQRFASTMDLAAIGIAHVDDNGRLLYVNPQLCKMLQYPERELTGMNVKQISHPDDANATDAMRDQLRTGAIDSFKIEKRYLRKDGSALWVGLTIAAKRDQAGDRIADISIVEDISVRKSAEERVLYLATHDGLTGLPNRAMFSEFLQHAVEAAKRRADNIAVLFVDLDRFKIVNDSLGHEAGDLLLREIASRLRQTLHATDVVARLGGDEFVVLLHDVTVSSQAAMVARKILSAIMKPTVIMGQECRVTASIGVCLHPMDGQDGHAVMKSADMAMYQAKEHGRNNYQFFSPAIRAEKAGRLALETNLRRALELDELSLHYQAKVNCKTGLITGVEALLRWHSPVLGEVSPIQFIPVAEETGLIVPIGKWVLRKACAQNGAWQLQGLPPVRICVNLSMRQLDDPNLIAEIKFALDDSGLSPDLLELEMTESMIMHNADHAVAVLTGIKALGARLAIDDFGTGYSSLAHLKRLPIDTLKVDRSFIREIPRDAEDRAITEAIIALGKTLSLTIVAEGVETPEQQNFLCEKACDEMQGFYFSKPVKPEEFAEVLSGRMPLG